ncbi:ANTAR domain-containing protein [Mycobacterium sp. URHD0025]|uniref:ANTAR domain-containing protein n=1 Tax=Mycobacterium sp. URHD0025 TaxID=1298864 RepID=UPI00040E880A|nr:ANTAR domain-containing protein [Mycobacterium sp. URHD0025]
MYAHTGSPGQTSAGARALDTAKGIVVGLRRCSVEQAFDEIVEHARQHSVGPICLADALVAIAQAAPTHHLDDRVVDAARTMWDQLQPSPAGHR